MASFLRGPPGALVGSAVRASVARPGPARAIGRVRKRERVQVLAADNWATGDLVRAELAEVVRAGVGLGAAGERPGVFGRDVDWWS